MPRLSISKKEEITQLLECPTATDETLAQYKYVIDDMVTKYGEALKSPSAEAIIEQITVADILKGCLFVGHIKTDLDSVAGAIGAANLFGGTPATAERTLNGEVHFALKYAGLEAPEYFDDIPGACKPKEDGTLSSVCLVDHNELKQMVPALRDDPKRKDRIVGLIDHHAVSEAFITERALLVDVRPWGSMSSIVAHNYLRTHREITKPIARILLCAILSDTLNLRSVTTTKADRLMVGFLARLGEVGGSVEINELASNQFRAKTEYIINLGAYEMVRGDQKDFTAKDWKFGIAVLEVTDPEPVLAVAEELLMELRLLKKEKGKQEDGTSSRKMELDFAYLFVVDVTKQRSKLLICGGRELALAKVAFPGCSMSRPSAKTMKVPGKTISADEICMDVGNLVSRKSQFAPAFFKALLEGFECHKLPNGQIEDEEEQEETGNDDTRKRKAMSLLGA